MNQPQNFKMMPNQMNNQGNQNGPNQNNFNMNNQNMILNNNLGNPKYEFQKFPE